MKIFRRFESAIVLAGLLAVGIVSYSLWLTESTIDRLMPLIQISNDLKVKISSAHLWFEEALEGDTTVNLQTQVYGNIEDAIRLVHEQLSQTQKIDSELYRTMADDLNHLVRNLQAWRNQTSARWNDRFNSQAGTRSDEQYDASFEEILRMCDENKRNIDVLVMKRQKILHYLHVAFILFLLTVFSVLTAIFVRYRLAMEAKNLALLKVSQAVEQTDDIVTITNREGVIEYINPAFEKFTGYSSVEAVGRNPSILKSGKHEMQFYQNLWQSIVAGNIFRSEVINRKKDGELYYEEKTISPIRDPEGNITHYVSTAKDITQRKSMERELTHAREMKIMGQIASGVAHEVRNPLNAILAISEAMFQDFAGQPEYVEYLDHIRNQVRRLSTLMSDLLELGKPIPPSTMRVTTAADLCRASIDLWKQYHPNPLHEIRFIDKNGEAKVVVNHGKLQQVFVNLLDNAIQNSSEQTEIQVLLWKPENGLVRISVLDRGSGIAPENIDRIFEPFFTKRKSGTGLGLSIVKHIIETHGGTISARNNDPAPGCCLEIQLPLAKDVHDETTDPVNR